MKQHRYLQNPSKPNLPGLQISTNGNYITVIETEAWGFTQEVWMPECKLEEVPAVVEGCIQDYLARGYQEWKAPVIAPSQTIGREVPFSSGGTVDQLAELRHDRILTLPSDKSGPLCLWNLGGELVFRMAHSHNYSYDFFASDEPGVVLLAPEIGYYSPYDQYRLIEVIRLTEDGNAFTIERVIIEGLGEAERIYGRGANASHIFICTETESRVFDIHSGALHSMIKSKYSYESAAYLLGEGQIVLFQNKAPYCIGFQDVWTGEVIREMEFSGLWKSDKAETYAITPDGGQAIVNGSVGTYGSDTLIDLRSLERVATVTAAYPDDPYASRYCYLRGISADARVAYYRSPSVGLVGVDTSTGEKLWRKTPHVSSNLLVSAAGKWLAYEGGGRLRLRDANTGEPLLPEDGIGNITEICRYPHLKRYVVCSKDIFVLDEAGTVLHRWEGEFLTMNTLVDEFVFWNKGRIQCFNLVRDEMVHCYPESHIEYNWGVMERNLNAVAFQSGTFLVFSRHNDWFLKIPHRSDSVNFAISPQEDAVYYAGR